MLIRTFFYRLFFTGFLFSFFSANIWAQGELDSVEYVMGDTVLARELLEEGKELIKDNEFENAANKLIKAKNICIGSAPTDSLILGEIYFQLGRYYIMSGQYPLAISTYFNSLKIKESIFGKTNPEVALLLNNIGNAYYYSGQYKEAYDYFQEALTIRLYLFGESHIDVAANYLSIGAFFFTMEDYDRAFIYYKRAQHIWKKQLGEKHRYIAMSYNNLGNCLKVKGHIKRAITYFKKAIEIWQSLSGHKDPDLALSYYNIGNIMNESGDYEKAIEYHQIALNIRLNTVGENHMETAQSYNSIGSAWWSYGDKKKATYYFDRALTINKNILNADHPYLCYSLDQLGHLLKEDNEYTKSLKYFRTSLVSKSKTYEKKHSEIAQSYSNIASVQNLQKNIDSAIFYYNLAIKSFSQTTTNKNKLSNIYQAISRIYFNHGQYEKALNYLDSSFVCIGLIEGNVNEQTPLNIDFIDALELKSAIYRRRYQLTGEYKYITAAKNYLGRAAKAIEFQINTLSAGSRTSWVKKTHAFYENTLSINQLIFQNEKDSKSVSENFYITERSKSLLLYQSIQETDALQYAGIPDSLLQQEYDLRIDITYYDKKRQKKISEGLEETDTTVLAISSKLFDLNREYEALKERFETDYPDYYKLKYDLSTVSLGYVQDTLLAADQTLLEYFVGDSSIFIFTIGKDKYDVVEVKRDFPLEDWVKQLQNGLTGYYTQPLALRTDDLYKETIQQYIEASQQLYGKLVAPVKEQLNTPNLIIVPDGLLGYVPFGALLSGQPERVSNFKTYPFLEKDYRISYCYSATLLREMKEKQHKQEPTGSLVAFAPFYEGSYARLDSTFSLTFDTLANGQDTLIFNDIVTRKDFNNLPASGEEV